MSTEQEAALDQLVRMSARIIGASIAVAQLTSGDRRWSIDPDHGRIAETSRVATMRDWVLGSGRATVVYDTARDGRFHDDPRVEANREGDAGPRFLSCFPLRTPDGVVQGTLIVLDDLPRTPTSDQLVIVQAFADEAIAELQLPLARARSPLAALPTQADGKGGVTIR